MENYFFNRIYSLIIGYPSTFSGFNSTVSTVGNAKQISGLRLMFDINKTETPESNSAVITIYGLSDDTRAFIKERSTETSNDGMIVILKAGYEELHGKDLPILFTGDITGVFHDTTKPEIITTLDCADGLVVIKSATFSKSYSAGVPVAQIFNDIIQAMSMPIQYADSKTKKFSFSFYEMPEYKLNRGYAFDGLASDALRRLCIGYGMRWSIQNARLKIYPAWDKKGNPWTDKIQSFLIAGEEKIPSDQKLESVLIGSPKRLAKNMMGFDRRGVRGYEFDALLMPKAEPGGSVTISSRTIKNSPITLVMSEVHHHGDTHGQDWKTTVKARDLQR